MVSTFTIDFNFTEQFELSIRNHSFGWNRLIIKVFNTVDGRSGRIRVWHAGCVVAYRIPIQAETLHGRAGTVQFVPHSICLMSMYFNRVQKVGRLLLLRIKGCQQPSLVLFSFWVLIDKPDVDVLWQQPMTLNINNFDWPQKLGSNFLGHLSIVSRYQRHLFET